MLLGCSSSKLINADTVESKYPLLVGCSLPVPELLLHVIRSGTENTVSTTYLCWCIGKIRIKLEILVSSVTGECRLGFFLAFTGYINYICSMVDIYIQQLCSQLRVSGDDIVEYPVIIHSG